MTSLEELRTPALILDLDKLESNIEAMAQRARQLGVLLRPHIKTHKCIEIARLQQAAGCHGLTVSTLQEAEVFADHGFEDLTWAFPVILNRIGQARALAERIRLGLLVDSVEAVRALEAEGFPFRVWLKVDCGYHRAGVDPTHPGSVSLARRLADSDTLRFEGLLTHSGHAYKASTKDDLRAVAAEERTVMSRFAGQLRQRGVEVRRISVGSTPAMSVVDNLEGIDEARPGNYVFFDLMQVRLGACAVSDCAATVLASVVSSQAGAERCVIDAGALALSKDAVRLAGDTVSLGGIYGDYAEARLRQDCHLESLSQEHGMVTRRFPVGSRVRILPIHSCLTVACFNECAVVRGDRVVDRWQIRSGR